MIMMTKYFAAVDNGEDDVAKDSDSNNNAQVCETFE